MQISKAAGFLQKFQTSVGGHDTISWISTPAMASLGNLGKGDFERHTSTGSGLFRFPSSGFA